MIRLYGTGPGLTVLWGLEPERGRRQPRDRFLSAEKTYYLHAFEVLSAVVPQDKRQIEVKIKRVSCAFHCPRTRAAPACASTSCCSCANSRLSCSKYWANFITFGFCLSTRRLSNGVLVAIRERVRCCPAPR